MRNDKLIPGTILVIIGALFLLDNFGVINFSWSNFFHLWPIILVIAGVNLVFAHNRTPAASAIKVLVLIVGMGFLIFGGLGHHQYGNNWGFHHHGRNWNYSSDSDTMDNDDNDTTDDDDNNDRSITKVETAGKYNEAYKPSLRLAVLNISGGGATYTLNQVTNQLFEADTKEYGNRYSLKTNADSTSETLDFDMNNSHHHGVSFNFGDTKANRADIKLNTNPEWEINVEAGAAKLKFDLSPFKVKKLKLEGGAASFYIKMGQPLTETNLDISTGVSEVTLEIPQNAACHITTDTGLSSKTFNGFNNVGDDDYETPGFANAAHKMYVKLSGGVSDFKVRRY